jgi:hypothetical protein
VTAKEPTTERATDSGIEVKPVYVAEDLDRFDEAEQLGRPGEYPYTRGVQPTMYRGRLWTMRQYAGFGSAEATNQRFKFLLEAGQTGLSCAFDLPTQMGYDADHARSEGEVGKVGVAISSLHDMRLLFADLPLDEVTTSMTINSTASTLLLLYQLVGEEQGVRGDQLRGTIQNDILKEYVARGTYIYPPRPSMRLIVDTFSYCAKEMPNWNTISISGYHIREAGSTAVQEVAFTLANGIAYVEAALAAGLALDDFAPRLSFFFNAHNNLFEEVAKYRAARRLWATIMRERFGAKDPKSMMLRFHTQTGGSTLTAQQPENNIVRVTIQALAAALGGTQSLHTNGFDEALGLPTERAAKLALRTQQVLGFESGVADTAVLRRVADQRGRTPGARLHRGHRRPGRGGRRDRVALHARRDRRGGLRVRPRRRPRRQGRRRGQSVHRGRVHQGRRVPRGRSPAARAGRAGVGTEDLARRRRRARGPRGRGERRAWIIEPAVPDEDGAIAHGDARRGRRRAASRVRRVPAELALERLGEVGHLGLVAVERVGERAPLVEEVRVAKRLVRRDRRPAHEQEIDRVVLLLSSHLGSEAVGRRFDDGQGLSHRRLELLLTTGRDGQDRVFKDHEREISR